ncbi:PAS domain S-box protein [Halosegnis longus]|uniref:PAS domain S-box protein n=1 Tax=Halosegnis longus TaxID=2216012 RepID=UPI00096A9302|nr:PAS domain S-box protein [Salella cibi]
MTARVICLGQTCDGAVGDALSAAGYTVETVATPADARERLPGAAALVVGPTISPEETLSLCRQNVSVVVYADEGDASFASELFAAGADDYVLSDECPPASLPDRLDGSVAMAPEQQYRQLFDTLGDFVYVMGEDGTFLAINDAAVELSGYEREELVGEHVSVLMDETDVRRGQEKIRELLDGADTVTYEMSVQTKHGEQRYVENHVALLPAPEGEFRGTVGVLRDVTDRHRRDQRLHGLHDTTRQLFAASDPETIADRVVDAAGDVLGHEISMVRLREEDHLVPASTPQSVVDRLGERGPVAVDADRSVARAFRSGESVYFDGDDPDDLPLEGSYYVPLGSYGVLSIGITDPDGLGDSDRTLANVLAANATAALDRLDQRRVLAAERDRFAALFENVPDPAVYVEFEGDEPIARDVNPAFESVFGYDRELVLDDSLDKHIIPESNRHDAEQYNANIRAGESFHGEVRRLTSEGPRDFLLHVVPYEIGSESTRGFAVYTDITEQKRRERELERQNERLDEFAAVVSHDLRNPLNVARGRLELARETGEPEQFEKSIAALDRMERLVSGLLSLARHGQSVGEPEAVDLDSVVHAAWGSVPGDATLAIEATPTIRADPERLSQLFENLFRNAVEHGDRPTVTVGPLPTGFYVADDGPGVPADERDQVFEFGHSGGDGTGFGLAIVRSIAEAHDWAVSLTDSESGGARFEFTGVEFVE